MADTFRNLKIQPKSRENKNLNKVKYIKKILDALDIERLADTGLNARTVMYFGKRTTGSINDYVNCEGVLNKDETGKWDKILPQVIYSIHKTNEKRKKLSDGSVPSDLFFNSPDYLIMTINSTDLNDLVMIRDQVLPMFYFNHYIDHGPAHSSIFQLNVGKEEKPTEYVLYMSAAGLSIRESPIDDVKIFTKKDIETLMQLK